MKQKKIIYEQRMQFIQRGHELDRKDLAKGIYAVNYRMSKKNAEQQKRHQEQWGIILVDENLTVYDSYNVASADFWSENTMPISENWHIFNATEQELQFTNFKYIIDGLNNQLAQFIEDNGNLLDKIERIEGRSVIRSFVKRIVDFFS